VTAARRGDATKWVGGAVDQRGDPPLGRLS
jgi:hypothetical protein